MLQTIRVFSLARCLEAALALATYDRDEDGVIVARVPEAIGFYSQGETEAEARENLADAIEGTSSSRSSLACRSRPSRAFLSRSSVSKLSPLKSGEVVHRLRALGYVGPVPGGRRMHMVHAPRSHIIPVPTHKGQDGDVDLIRTIIQAACTTPDA